MHSRHLTRPPDAAGPSGRAAAAGALALILAAAACATTSTVVVTATSPTTAATGAAAAAGAWPLRVREHVDLWLHGFAMLTADSSLVPYFRNTYRTQLTADRRAAAATTLLDANAERLRAGIAANPALGSAQFLALYFDSWEEMRRSADVFLQLEGNARRAMNAATARLVATFAAYFRSDADRDWLRLYLATLDDERSRFFNRYWLAEQRVRGPVFDRADALWRDRYRARFGPFLANMRQRDGEVVAALALGGEGRTLVDGNRPPAVAVGFPRNVEHAERIFLVFAHEVVGTTASAVVVEHTSPADRRSGVADRYTSLAAVRGGAMLLRRVAPELVEPYQRYYLEQARVAIAGSDVAGTFATTFPLPDPLRDALDRQIDIILGGI
jgi:hypothetical protein